MSDYISRETVRRIVDSPRTKTQMLDMLASCPPEDVRLNIHAYWEDLEPDKDILFKSNMPYRCTACGQRAGKHKVSTYKYCPSCGAIMDGEPKGEKGE